MPLNTTHFTHYLQFDLAKHNYEAQIMWIRSRPRIDIKALAICHGRLGKMFLNLGGCVVCVFRL